MMRTIYRYSVPAYAGLHEIEVEPGAIVFAAERRPSDDSISIYAIVSTGSQEKAKRHIAVRATGEQIMESTDGRFLASLIFYPFVWHVFEMF